MVWGGTHMLDQPTTTTSATTARRSYRSLIALLVTIAIVLAAIFARFVALAPHGLAEHPSPSLGLSRPTAFPQATAAPGTALQKLSGTVVPGATPATAAIIPGFPPPDQDSAQQQALRANIGNPAKVIMVSIDGQFLQAWDHGKLVKWTYVTTGRPGMETPHGTFHIFYKQSPLTFYPISTDPASVYFGYASKVQYGMEFAEGGYYIHDVWWRTVYGPRLTLPHWDPGRLEYSDGSHGCINTPLEAMNWLYAWTPMGTPVIVY